MSKVRGTQAEVKVLEVSVDTVYIRTNIQRIIEDDFIGWEYNEQQLTFGEYLEMIGNIVL